MKIHAGRIRTAVSLVLLLVLVGIAACEHSAKEPTRPSVEEKMVDAGLRNADRPAKLRIGVYNWQPPMGYVDNGTNEGFDVEVARYIAKNLGYDGDDKIEWTAIDNVADRIKFLQQNTVDLVVASFSITDFRKRSIGFAGPYLITEQSVMVPVGMKGKISTIEDLKDSRYKVCTATGSTSEALMVERKIPYSPLDSDLDCFEGLKNGKFQAMTTDRTVLYGLAAKDPGGLVLLDMKLATATNPGTERLGIGVAKNNVAMRELVDYFLNKSYLDQQRGLPTEWQRAYSKHLTQFGQLTQPRPDHVPDLVDFDAKSPTP